MKTHQTSTILSVTELTQSIKSCLEMQYRFIHIQGEVSNLRIPYSGHSYFTLKDQNAQIRAVLFKGQKKYLQRDLEEGQSIVCHGRLSVYAPRGEYQIIVDTIDFAGTGNLQIQFEQLKKSLAEEGLFDPAIKKPLPPFPEHIAVITSATGAAVHDFLKIAEKRRYWGTISILPVAVQGNNSSEEIAQALALLELATDIDVAVLIRGGGSLEDLWSFNEERTARAIHRATIPIVTGIGHETDYTIADMCADMHTHTPTAAAEAIIPDTDVLRKTISQQRRSLALTMMDHITDKEENVAGLRRVMGNLDLFLANHALKLDYRLSSLTNAAQRQLATTASRLEAVTKKLHYQAPLNKIAINDQRLEHLRSEMMARMAGLLGRKTDALSRQAALLDSVSPLSILSRGYAIVEKIDPATGKKKIVADSGLVEKGDRLDIRLNKGEVECEVTDTRSTGA